MYIYIYKLPHTNLAALLDAAAAADDLRPAGLTVLSANLRNTVLYWLSKDVCFCNEGPPNRGTLKTPTVSFHNFKSQNFKSSVSNPKSKYVAYLSVLSQISNCQSLGRKNKHEILKTDRTRPHRFAMEQKPVPSAVEHVNIEELQQQTAKHKIAIKKMKQLAKWNLRLYVLLILQRKMAVFAILHKTSTNKCAEQYQILAEL